MATITSTADGMWANVFSPAPGATDVVVIKHQVVLPNNASVNCGSLVMSASGGIPGSFGPFGPNCTIVLGTSQTLRLGSYGTLEQLTSTNIVPKGRVG